MKVQELQTKTVLAQTDVLGLQMWKWCAWYRQGWRLSLEIAVESRRGCMPSSGKEVTSMVAAVYGSQPQLVAMQL